LQPDVNKFTLSDAQTSSLSNPPRKGKAPVARGAGACAASIMKGGGKQRRQD